MPETTELQTRGFTITAETFDSKNNTIEMSFASTTPVRRRDWQGPFDEVLDVSLSAIDQTRLNSGAMSLLDNHNSWSMESRLGVVLANTMRIEGTKAYVRVKLSSEKADTLIRDLKDGMPFAVSVGYRIHEYALTEDDVPVRTITKWEPVELSAVPIPADPTAQTRKDASMPAAQLQNQNEKQTTRTRADEERDILSLAKRFKMDLKNDLVTRSIADQVSYDEFREALIDHMTAEDERDGSIYITPMDDVLNPGRHSEPAQARQDRSDAIYARLSGTAPTERARPYMSMSLLEHARGILHERGENTRLMTPDQIFKRSIATGDFPLLLKSTGNRMLVDAYQLAQSPLKTAIARASTIDDFRKKSRLKISDIDKLQKVGEGGEIKHTSRAETAEGYALETYASLFKITRQALINDDLGAFADFNRTAGRMSAETENALLFSLLTQNSGVGPTLEETGNALFHADHGNLASSGTAIDVAALKAARLAMRKQKSLGGKAFINAVPKFLMVGPELETQAEQVLASLAAATVDEVNPFAGRLSLLVEPRIEDASWYVFADPASVPTIEYSYLSTQPGPQFESEESFDVLGTQFRVYLDFGVGAVDFRGAYRNPGE